jgi:hypothetical protein
MWMPIPLWLIGAILYAVQMSSTPPSFYKRLAVGMLAATCAWMPLVVVATATTYTVVSLSVMIPIQFLLNGGFVAAADMAYRAAFGPLSWDLSKMRNLRGVHLGLNIAGLFVFPIFTYIGVPLTLAKLARHRRTNKHLFGWSVACGTLTLIVLTALIIFAAIVAGGNDFNNSSSSCRKRAVLQIIDMNMTTSTIGSSNFILDSLTDSSTIATTTFTRMTIDPCANWEFSNSWTAPASWIVGSAFFYGLYTLQTIENLIAVAAVSLFAAIIHLMFIILADQLILKNMEAGQGAVLSQSPSESTQEQLAHPCASCGTMLQFVRADAGTLTKVQCYQCHAIVELTIE